MDGPLTFTTTDAILTFIEALHARGVRDFEGFGVKLGLLPGFERGAPPGPMDDDEVKKEKWRLAVEAAKAEIDEDHANLNWSAG